MKKVLAAVLAFAMVVTGMYFVKPEASEVKAATTVPADMLDVKLQVSNEANKTMRLITSVDSLDYDEVGFKVTNGTGASKTMSTTTVFEKIKSSVGEKSYNFSPKLIGTSSEYFATVKFNVANPDNTYTVQAYVKKGEEVTWGREIRSFQFNDGTADNYVNLLVQGTLTEGVTATYGPNATATDYTADSVTILGTNDGYTSVKVDLAGDATVDGLKSATKFIFKNGDEQVATGVYRNYYTTHYNPESDTTLNKCTDFILDRSWYDVNPSGTYFVIATSADMYGFASIVNNANGALSTSFEGRTVTLVADVALNDGKAVKSTASAAPTWTKTSGMPVYQWAPIGNSTSKTFRGTFDGDGNEISGMYMLGGTDAMFGYVTGNGVVIKDFKLVNSYIYTGSYNGAGLINFAGTGSAGTYRISDVYMDVTISSDGRYLAGFISQADYGTTVYMDRCWFAGEIYSRRTVTEQGISPFIAHSCKWTQKYYFTNCINSGNVKAYGGAPTDCGHSNLPGGGYGTFMGSCHNQNIIYEIKNCVDFGGLTITDASKSGNLIGMPARQDGTSAITITATNVYVTNAEGRPTSYLGAEPNGLVFNQTNLNTIDPTTLLGLSEADLLAKFPETVSGEGCDWGYAADGTLMPKTYINWYNAQ